MLLNSDNLDKTLSFETVAGEKYTNLKFVDILSASTVMSLQFDAPAKHAQYYPYLTGVSDDFNGYKYAKFLKPDNSILYLGIPWVKATSIVANTSPVRLIRLPATVTEAQMNDIRSYLTTINIDGYTVEVL